MKKDCNEKLKIDSAYFISKNKNITSWIVMEGL